MARQHNMCVERNFVNHDFMQHTRICIHTYKYIHVYIMITISIYHVLDISRTGNPLVSLLLTGSYSHSDNARQYAVITAPCQPEVW